MARLALKNSIVEQINDYMLDMILGEAKIYLSYDFPISRSKDGYRLMMSTLLNILTQLIHLVFQIRN